MTRILAIGELLWDLLPAAETIGGAPYNFAVHCSRLGYEVDFVSAVGDDERGRRALAAIGGFSRHVQVVNGAATGVAHVALSADRQPSFEIARPAAYDYTSVDAVETPDWIAHGTLFAASEHGARALDHAIARFPRARRFYDLNLRPGQWTSELVMRLACGAGAVKLSESEMREVAAIGGFPSSVESFCPAASNRLGWAAVAVTYGAEGCVVAMGGDVARVSGYPVAVADAVGAGDAFSAGFLHGVIQGWSAAETADFANRIGALVASRSGATPEWSPAELDALTR